MHHSGIFHKSKSALLNLRASKITCKPWEGLQDIEPPLGSCDRPRKPIVSKNLLMEPRSLYFGRCSLGWYFLREVDGSQR